MPGPCSLPTGPKSEWEKHNGGICDIHDKCWPDQPKNAVNHRFITVREYRIKRGKHETGKTK